MRSTYKLLNLNFSGPLKNEGKGLTRRRYGAFWHVLAAKEILKYFFEPNAQIDSEILSIHLEPW